MRGRAIAQWLAGVLLVCGLAACMTVPQRAQGPYMGPTWTMRQVVERINANNRPLRTLWAAHEFEATIIEPDGQSHFVNGRGVLLYRGPHDLLLQGKKDFGTVFEVGSNAERFWLTLFMGPETMWWGDYANIARPCAQPMPIRPEAFLEVLGTNVIDTDFLSEPVPTMRFNNDADAYMFVWNEKHQDRWIARREIWYDRQTLRPILVVLFDSNGRIILRAYLSDHQPVEVPDLPEDQWPRVATRYQLYFPDTGSRMSFHLTELRLNKRGVPNDRTFEFPVAIPVPHIVRVDEGCQE